MSSGVPWIAVFFWSSVAISLITSIAGVLFRMPPLFLAGAFFAVPIAFYLGSIPRFRTIGYFLPAFQLLAGLLVLKSRWMAAVLLLPIVAGSGWLAFAVLSQ